MNNAPDVQQILNTHLAGYVQTHPLDGRRCQVCRHIQQCHTQALGGLQMRCDHCAHEETFYFGCRDRHCPQCQYGAARQWAQKQQQAALPVTYHHLVCPLPHTINPWAQLHPEVIYRLLFESVWETLKAFALDPKRLGGQLGATMMLHTWGQTLIQHLHLHCLVPGGVLTPDGEWKPATSTYLFPVRALSRRLRGVMVSKLRAAYEAGKLYRVTDTDEPKRTLDKLMSKEWVVYSKPCIRADDIVEYLARYSHRTAISNSRILGMADHQIRFRYKDYADEKIKVKSMCLDAEEFIRRYLLHVLPKGLQRIRHCGFLSNCCRAAKLTQIREAIGKQQDKAVGTGNKPPSEPSVFVSFCPKCQTGKLNVIAELPRERLDGG